MKTSQLKKVFTDLLAYADITVNGDQPYDIQIKNSQFYSLVLHNPSLGMGESYMNGWWECAALDDFFYRLLRADIEQQIEQHKEFFWPILRSKLKMYLTSFVNLQSPRRAFIVGRHHYDLGNELYQAMLDKRLNYSCGYWLSAADLDTAQLAKLAIVCQKLQLKSGMRLLDIGCGWGSLAQYAAENYGVSVVGITVSKEQFDYAQEKCAALPIEIRLQDYRELNEKFDRICSIGMFEHVGYKNYSTFMQVAARCLKDDGLFLLHTIGDNFFKKNLDEWIEKYIFPNGRLPSISQIGQSIEKIFVMEDWHNFGADYDKTLMAWQANFVNHWPSLKKQYDERFYRMWNYYLLSCAGAFRARTIQLWQIVLSRHGLLNGYQRPLI